MEEIHLEHLIKRKKSKKDILSIILFIICGVIFTPMAIYYGIALRYLGYVFLLAVFGIWWCIIRLVKSKNVEYEYVYTNGTIDIDMIIAGSRRGRVISIDPSELELFAHISVPFDKPFKTLNCSTKDESDDLYYIITERYDVGTVRVLFNPSQAIVDAFKAYRPSKVNLGDKQ